MSKEDVEIAINAINRVESQLEEADYQAWEEASWDEDDEDEEDERRGQKPLH